MPLRDCPFTYFDDKIARPVLPIRIINPHTEKDYLTYGIIDTGADECAVPAWLAKILGHNLEAGIQKTIYTGNVDFSARLKPWDSQATSPRT